MTAPHVVTPSDLPAPYSGPPLTIGYIGNFRHPWCTEVHVAASLESLGHTVIRQQEDEHVWSEAVAGCELLGVQLVLWTRTWPQEMDDVLPALKELAAMGIPTVSYHLDRWFGLNRQHQVDDQPFFRTSLVVSPDDSPLWPEHGVNHFWLPPGVYGPECEPVAPNPRRWPYDVVFVGSHPYPHPEWAKYRSDLITAFSRAFRGRFGILPRRGVPIRGRDLQELYATVPVVVGDTCLAGQSFGYLSDRCPETIGRGGFLIHPFVKGMVDDGPDAWYQHGRDIMGYQLGDFSGAVDIAKAALTGSEGWDRHRIASTGRATVLARDTYAHRMGTVLAVAEGIHGGYRDVERGVAEEAADMLRFVATHSVSAVKLSDFPVAPPPTPRHSVRLHRWSAIFEPRPGTTDFEVIGEVWMSNDYKVPKEGFSGTVVDIGANVGAFSVLAAKAGAKRVLAFEPEQGNYDMLLRNVEANRVRGVECLRQAITNGATEKVFMTGGGGGARAVMVSSTPHDSTPTTTLRRVLSTIGGAEFIKCDIEGGEYAAFAALPVEYLAHVQTIALEFHGPGMPHLSHMDDDGKHLERWGALVAKLADAGRVETFGHPMRGGLIHWRRYGA